MKNVNSLCLPVPKIGFIKSDILMPGLLVLLLQYFVVIPCVPEAHGLLFVLSTQYACLVFTLMLHRSSSLLPPFDFWKASESITKQMHLHSIQSTRKTDTRTFILGIFAKRAHHCLCKDAPLTFLNACCCQWEQGGTEDLLKSLPIFPSVGNS